MPAQPTDTPTDTAALAQARSALMRLKWLRWVVIAIPGSYWIILLARAGRLDTFIYDPALLRILGQLVALMIPPLLVTQWYQQQARYRIRMAQLRCYGTPQQQADLAPAYDQWLKWRRLDVVLRGVFAASFLAVWFYTGFDLGFPGGPSPLFIVVVPFALGGAVFDQRARQIERQTNPTRKLLSETERKQNPFDAPGRWWFWLD